MRQKKDHLEILVKGNSRIVKLLVYPQSSNAELFEDDSPYVGEAKYQLIEGATYVYEFEGVDANDSHTYQFKNEDEIIAYHHSPRHPCEGTIRTGIYVGQLGLMVRDITGNEDVGRVRLEIRSTKSDYEEDYRQMLDEIAEYYTDLVLQQGSPVTQHLEIDDSSPSQTLYQRFSFIRSIIDSEAFSEAVHKIISNPVRKWTDTNIQRNIVNVKRLSRKNIRQIASSHDRVNLPSNCRRGLPEQLKSVPRRIEVEYKRDTVDNQENQFVKFVLRTFAMFCSELKEKKNASQRLVMEAEQTITHLNAYLDNQFFRQVSMPSHMNLNSPVLQRKEGYRELLQSWLLFDLAAKLNWKGGDDVYEAGKKNVATLYEYWLFFKLLELISEFFDINPKEKTSLVRADDDGINLNIVQGKMQMVRGQQVTFSRLLNVAFYYNRTFNKVPESEGPVGKAGSWTLSMRPDYTLSLWPGDISEEQAEKEELVVHIHFDAKYRLNKIVLENMSDEDVDRELSEEKKQQELGIYKRADLLKMHAYKDAIRRTGGAYVLYPGTESKEIRGFHEIVPGLGAFSIRPGHWREDSVYLKMFLAEVKAHLLNRASDREKLSYYQYDIHREAPHTTVMENLPESEGINRDFMPDETTVIVARYKNQAHLNWILKEHLYNMRAGLDKGSMELKNEIVNARYLLLHDGRTTLSLIKIRKDMMKVFTRAQLLKLGYPPYTDKNGKVNHKKEKREANRIYLVFSLYKNNSAEKELLQYKWDVNDILLSSHVAARAFPLNLVELIKRAKK